MKPTLLIVEGPDRVSKDTILAYKYANFISYSAIKEPPPNYRTEQSSFLKYLANLLKNQQIELINLGNENKSILMVRLFTSEYVYSSLFNRKNIFNEFPSYINELSKVFNIEQLIILYHDYDQYLNRCKTSNSEIEYTKDEFIKTKDLYINSPYNKLFETNIMFTKDNDINNITSFIAKKN